METIKNYLENVFAAMPQNEQVLKLKANLVESMEDKYNELKQFFNLSGKGKEKPAPETDSPTA